MDYYLPAEISFQPISWQAYLANVVLPLPIFPAIAICIFLPFTFYSLRTARRAFGIYLIYDFTKLLGIVLEIEIINFTTMSTLPLYFIHDEIFVKIVDTFQIIQRHLLLIITTALLDILAR